MSSSHSPTTYQPAHPLAQRDETTEQNRIRNHHTQEWSSGTRGGGKVPADFGWRTNPKQWQEELGSAVRPDKEKGQG